MKLLQNFAKVCLLLFLVLFLALPVRADDLSTQDLEQKIKEYEQKVAEAQGKQKTLASAISAINDQIYLTSVRIEKTNQEITVLEDEVDELIKKITLLDKNLDETLDLLNNRIEETYKQSFLPSFYVLISADSFADFFSQVKYLRTAQAHDRDVLYEMEKTKANFDKQKELKEEKQKELEKLQGYLISQQSILAQQKILKQDLLEVTKNDEATYQKLLEQARSEYEAIQAITAGQTRSSEKKIGEVKTGERIASIKTGRSCNSSGTHLHFSVSSKGNSIDPFMYLKTVDYENCSGPGVCTASDSFNPRGSWDWPIDPKINFSQGYGVTWFVKTYGWYPFHNGIDFHGSSTTVKTVQNGELYQGSYYIQRDAITGQPCYLQYVRVDHKDSDLETFYLHVNY